MRSDTSARLPGKGMHLPDLPTEQHRTDLLDLDLRPVSEQVRLMVDDHEQAVVAVRAAAPALEAAIAAVVDRLATGPGRLVYVGSGTAGRLGHLDALECDPTFGSDRVIALLAGGDDAVTTAIEGAEDDTAAAPRDLRRLHVGEHDVVVGVTASGRTPYTLAAMDAARELGALTVGVSSNAGAALSSRVDHPIEVPTGAELIAGSTRLKAGTAQKVVLNTISTVVMVRLGRTFGNLMVNVRSINDKLRDRSRRMVADASGVPEAEAEAALDAAGGDHKVAIVSLLARVNTDEAARRLARADGQVRRALEA